MTSSGGHGAEGRTGDARPASAARARTAARTVITRWGHAIADIPRAVWFAAGAVAVVLVAVMLTGGLSPVRTTPAEVAAGTEVRTSTYALTAQGAELTDAVESEYLEAEAGEVLLVLTLRMENLTDAPIGVGTTADLLKANLVNTADPLLDLHGVTATGSATVWRADGSAGQVILQPGVPDEVTIAWPVPDDAVADGAVRLDVHDAEVSRGAVILSSRVVTWRPAELVARVSVTAEEAP